MQTNKPLSPCGPRVLGPDQYWAQCDGQPPWKNFISGDDVDTRRSLCSAGCRIETGYRPLNQLVFFLQTQRRNRSNKHKRGCSLPPTDDLFNVMRPHFFSGWPSMIRRTVYLDTGPYQIPTLIETALGSPEVREPPQSPRRY
jgi:hypothetical protein